jgi:hypothetical protein
MTVLEASEGRRTRTKSPRRPRRVGDDRPAGDVARGSVRDLDALVAEAKHHSIRFVRRLPEHPSPSSGGRSRAPPRRRSAHALSTDAPPRTPCSLVACSAILLGTDRHRLAWSLRRREGWRRAAADRAGLCRRGRVATRRRRRRRAPRVPDYLLDLLRDGVGLLPRPRSSDRQNYLHGRARFRRAIPTVSTCPFLPPSESNPRPDAPSLGS